MTTKNLWNTPEQRWQAVVERNKAADGHFVYGVRTSAIYCHPSAAGRLPNRNNVEFLIVSSKRLNKAIVLENAFVQRPHD